jgi:hypothetical protein
MLRSQLQYCVLCLIDLKYGEGLAAASGIALCVYDLSNGLTAVCVLDEDLIARLWSGLGVQV